MVASLLLSLLAADRSGAADAPHDLVIYGGTSAAVIAAVQATGDGLDVVVVSPDEHLGGLTAGGLGWTDSGKKDAIGGLSLRFYRDVAAHYATEQAWRQESRQEYLNRPRFVNRPPTGREAWWNFEPSVAEAIFERYVAENDITVHRGNDFRLDRGEGGVTKTDGRITAIRTLGGTTFAGKVFMDCTYEGDLMAAAGVSYHVGREGNDVYGETINGFQPLRKENGRWVGTRKHQFLTEHGVGEILPISPFVAPGEDAKSLLPYVQVSTNSGEPGSGDHRIQAYNFRMCNTNDPANRVPFRRPANYDPMNYELLARVLDAGWRGVWNKFDPVPNDKTDTNNHGAFSTDFIGQNYDYPEASYERREEIIQAHRDYQEGLMWFLANDPRVPEDVRETMSQWGLAKDEFTDNDHWPHQIYVREARRMIGRIVMSEPRIRGLEPVPESIGMGSYNMDSHNVQRYASDASGENWADAITLNEGDIQINPGGPYPISYQAITPKAEECTNLLVPVACSASHIAYGSIRMEPVFMILGQSAAAAAKLAIENDTDVQDVPYDALQTKLEAAGQVLDLPNSTARSKSIAITDLPGNVIDDPLMTAEGSWTKSSATKPFVGRGYLASNTPGATITGRWQARYPDLRGDYEVRLAGPPHSNRCGSVVVEVTYGSQSIRKTIDQRTGELFQTIGTLKDVNAGPSTEFATVTVTAGDGGYTVVDAVQFVPAK